MSKDEKSCVRKYLPIRKIRDIVVKYYNSKRGNRMKHFYAGTFMNREELKNVGIDYPIKLEYYKTKELEEAEETFGIEVVKTSYIHDKVATENVKIESLTKEEPIINTILDTLKKNEVTPINATYIVEDLLKVI